MTGGKNLRVSEVAKIFDVKAYTVRTWIKANKIEAIVLPSGQFRITQDEVNRLANEKYGAK